MKQLSLFDQIWLVVSPQSPLKDPHELIDENHRLKMAYLGLDNSPFLSICEIEFSMPRPSYTVDTLRELKKQYPDDEFCLILGADNLDSFHQWKDYEEILQGYKIYVYPRNNKHVEKKIEHPNIIYVDAPLLPFSSSDIRNRLKEGKSVSKFVTVSVENYIKENRLYGCE
jgi:nicotinate-nucleotide adenylyltransferase